MNVLLDLECHTGLLHYHTECNVKRLGLGCSLLVITAVNGVLWIICVLHVSTCEFGIELHVNKVLYELLIEFIYRPELSCEINHRTCLALLVHHKERRNTCSLCHKGVICTECRCYMYDTCTILGCNIVTGNYTESIGRSIDNHVTILDKRFNPWEKLCVVHSNEVGTLILSNNAVRHNLVTGLVLPKWKFCTGRIEMRCKQCLRKNHCYRLACVAVICLYCNVINLWTHTKCCV